MEEQSVEHGKTEKIEASSIASICYAIGTALATSNTFQPAPAAHLSPQKGGMPEIKM